MPQLAEFDMALQCGVHQLSAAAPSNRGFDDRQRQLGDSQALALDDVRWLQIASP